MHPKPPNAGKGRPKGSKNKIAPEMKVWAREFFSSKEWRESAVRRMLAGKAPHLESHIVACLMPRHDTLDVPGLTAMADVLSKKLVDEFYPGPGKTS